MKIRSLLSIILFISFAVIAKAEVTEREMEANKQGIRVGVSDEGVLPTSVLVELDGGAVEYQGYKLEPNHWFEWGGYTNMRFGAVTTTEGVEVVRNQCVGRTGGRGICYMDFRIKANSKGPNVETVVLNWVGVIIENGKTSTYPGQSTYIINFQGITRPPQEEQCEQGSLINVNQRSIIETIPIVGTDFSFNYSSAYTIDYKGPNSILRRGNSFNRESWTISGQHFFDKDINRLFLGTGHAVYTIPKVTDQGNLVVSPDQSEVYLFDINGKHLRTFTSLKGALKHQLIYDTNNRLVRIVDAHGNTTIFNRNSNGSIMSVTSPYGQVTEVQRNDNSAFVGVKNPNGETYEMTYKGGLATRLLETFKKPGGQVTRFSYNNSGLLIQDIGNGGNLWSLGVPANGVGLTKTSKLGRKTVYESSNSGVNFSARKTTFPTGLVETYSEPNVNSRRTASVIETTESTTVADSRFGSAVKRTASTRHTIGGKTSTTSFGQTVIGGNATDPFVFTSLTETATTSGRVVSKIFEPNLNRWTFRAPSGRIDYLTLNAFEKPASTQRGNETPIRFTYDAKGRLARSAQGSRNISQFQYDSLGRLAAVINGRSEKTDFTYDLAGRLRSKILPDGRQVAYTYDLNGNLTSVKPPSKPTHSFVLNAFEFVGRYSPPGIGAGIVKDTTYVYNQDKQLTRINRPDGKTVSFSYQPVTGLLGNMTASDSGAFQYAYHPTSKLLASVASPYGNISRFEYYGPYQSSQELVRTNNNFSIGKVHYAFDADHRVIGRVTRGNAPTPTYSFPTRLDADGRPIKIGDLAISYFPLTGRKSGTALGGVTDGYQYDAFGNVISYASRHTNGSVVTELYDYTLARDSMSRITSKTERILGTTVKYDYTYDPSGRLKTVKKNKVVITNLNYDSNSNRTGGSVDGASFSATYDAQDRIVKYAGRTYAYNTNGELLSIAINPNTKTSLVYDSLGNLKSVTLPNGVVIAYGINGQGKRSSRSVGGTVQKHFLYEPSGAIAAEMNNSGSVLKHVISSAEYSPEYVRSGGVNFKLIKDQLGSVRLVVNATTGAVVQRMEYGTFGKVISDTKPGYQPYGFAGGLYDHQTQLVRFGARDYDPETGRWTSKDPILFNGGDTNLFGYVANDPVNFVDPRGLWALQIGGSIAGLIGPIIGVGGSAESGIALSYSSQYGFQVAGYQSAGVRAGTGLFGGLSLNLSLTPGAQRVSDLNGGGITKGFDTPIVGGSMTTSGGTCGSPEMNTYTLGIGPGVIGDAYWGATGTWVGAPLTFGGR